MDNRPIVFLDSGIGGIPYCGEFASRNTKESLVYLADRRNYPYGKRSREELQDILKALAAELIAVVDPKMVVLACNTASVSALSFLRDSFPSLVFVGAVPAVKPAILGTKTGRIGVLGTERTIKDPYIAELAARYGSGCTVIPVAAPELVDFVEYRYVLAGEGERRQAVRPYIERFRAAGVDGLVLGCTHFLFLLDEFRGEAAPDICIYESIGGITRRIESLLDEKGGALRSGDVSCGSSRPSRLFYVRGDGGALRSPSSSLSPRSPSPSSFPGPWEDLARGIGFELRAL